MLDVKTTPDPTPSGAAPIFAALGDTTRLELVILMSDLQPRSITQLACGFAQTRQNISKHLVVLEQAGVVISRRQGRENRYSLDPTGIEPARHFLERASAQWNDVIRRLRAFVEEGPG